MKAHQVPLYENKERDHKTHLDNCIRRIFLVRYTVSQKISDFIAHGQHVSLLILEMKFP